MPYTRRDGQRVVSFATKQYQQRWQVSWTSRKVTVSLPQEPFSFVQAVRFLRLISQKKT